MQAHGGRTLAVSAVAYSLPGHTASGLPVGWGIVAVDPSVIPLGTHMTVPGYGEAVAADTGSAIKGAIIDLWFPTLAHGASVGPAVGHDHARLDFPPLLPAAATALDARFDPRSDSSTPGRQS